MSLKNKRGQLVKWFEKSGYGFIRFEDRDVFVHREAYLSGFAPERFQILAFDFGLAPDRNKPPVAINVRVTKSAKAVAAEEEIKRGLEALVETKGGV
jgi:cold shock CspA family protein